MNGAIEHGPIGQVVPASVDTSWYQSYTIIKQEVELEVNFREKSISGVTRLQIFPLDADIDQIALDARQMDIDVGNITVNGKKVQASYSDPYDLMTPPPQWQMGVGQHRTLRKRMAPGAHDCAADEERHEAPINERDLNGIGCLPADRSLQISLKPEPLAGTVSKEQDKPDKPGPLKLKITKADKDAATDSDLISVSIPFKSKRIRDGLHFVGVDDGDLRYPHVYSRHLNGTGSAPCIFPCVDDPGSRHPWTISIKCPRTLGDAFEQPLATQGAATTGAVPSRKRKHGEAVPPNPSPPAMEMDEEDKLMELTVVCSGNLSGEQIDPKNEKKKIMTFECQNSAAHHISFAIGPFEHVDLANEFRTEQNDEKLGASAAKIHVYHLPNRRPEILHTCEPIVLAADYFAPEFGKYPFESYKMCFVDDMIADTADATSMTLCSNRLLFPEEIIEPMYENTRTLVHALASQYLGVHIVPNTRSDSWLVIGIQWFMTDLFLKNLCGNNWYRFHLKTMADKLVELDIQRPSLRDLGNHLQIGDFELEFMSLKAPLVLFILDQRMSKIPGSTGVVRVVSSMVSNANIHNSDATFTCASDAEFRRNCEKRSQYKPDELWEQWVNSSGCPKLSVTQKFNKKNLNVDLTIKQTQSTPKSRPITKEDFWREFQEEIHGVYATEVPKVFTGPFTIRIHEADGTPYEHYQHITDKDRGGTQLSISYNTKYKRLKRTKKAQASANAISGKHDVQEDDVVYYNMFGDVLMSEKDQKDWGLQDWSKEMQSQMDQESYEWIRFDCNFEWVCETITDMPGYMYLAQLQQDWDVVAHQDAMLYFKRGKRHGVAATIETRTVMDRRYFYGIRIMAAEDLTKQADPDLNYIGLAQLILIYRHFFCNRVTGQSGITFPPLPNDFSDKAQYFLQRALPGAIARTRERGRCSKHGRNFLMDLLLFNDNSENEFADDYWIATLLEALTTSIIPDKHEGDKDLLSMLDSYDEEDLEFKKFIVKTLELIEKYRRQDEWVNSYQNIWTTTALNCTMRLMKARVIPVRPKEFVTYLLDENLDVVRIKAYECLVELGQLTRPSILKMFIMHWSTDRSPFVRDKLFKILCRGMAAIALGENQISQAVVPAAEIDDSGLVVEQGDAEIQQRKLDAVRKEDITHALKALKEELKGNTDFHTQLQMALWKAVESPFLGFKEKFQVLDLCSAMFEPEDSLLVTFNYPKFWTASRVVEATDDEMQVSRPQQKRCTVRFTQVYRTEPVKKIPFEPLALPDVPAPQPEIKREIKKIKLSSKPSFSGPSNGGVVVGGPLTSSQPTPPPLARQDSISATAARPIFRAASQQPQAAPISDTISVMRTTMPLPRPSTPIIESPLHVPPSTAKPNVQPSASARPVDKRPKQIKKGKIDEGDVGERPKKIAKVVNGVRSKIVTLKFRVWHRLRQDIQDSIAEEQRIGAANSTIHATPMAKHFGGYRSPLAASLPRNTMSPPASSYGAASSSEPVRQRKPLPSAAPHSTTGASSIAAAAPSNVASTPAPPRKIKLKINKSTSTPAKGQE